MTEQELKQAALLVVDDFLESDIPYSNVSEVLMDSDFDSNEEDWAQVFAEANDIMRYLRDRTDYYYE